MKFGLTCFCFVSSSLRLWNRRKPNHVIFRHSSISFATYVQLDHRDPPLVFWGQTRRRTTPQKILPRQMGLATLSTCTGSEEKFTFPLYFTIGWWDAGHGAWSQCFFFQLLFFGPQKVWPATLLKSKWNVSTEIGQGSDHDHSELCPKWVLSNIKTDFLSVFGSVVLHPHLLFVIKFFPLLLLLLQCFCSQGFLNKSVNLKFLKDSERPERV